MQGYEKIKNLLNLYYSGNSFFINYMADFESNDDEKEIKFKKAIEMDSYNRHAYYNLGWLYQG